MANRVNTNKVETFIVDIIKTFDSTITLTKADPFYDLFVRFYNLTALISILELVEAYETKQSYLNVAMPNADYDKLLDRWFYERSGGSSTKCTIALVFSSDINVFNVKTSDIFSINSFNFNTSSNSLVFQNTYSKVTLDVDVFEYTVKLDIVAQLLGSAVDINIGDEVTIPYNNLTGFLRAYVDSNVDIGLDEEDNTTAYNNLRESIQVQNLVSSAAIRGQFNRNLRSVLVNHQVVGFTDPEMYRDLIYTELPQKRASLLFAAKNNTIVLKKSEIVFWYNRNNSIVYTLKLPEGVTQLQASEDVWQPHPSGLYQWLVDIELKSFENPLGFREDVPLEMYRVVDTVQTNFKSNPDFLYANTTVRPRVDINSLPVQATVHIGGLTDIYVNVSSTRVTRKLRVPVNTAGVVSIPDEYKPILKVHEILDVANTPVAFWSFNTVDKVTKYTTDDTSYLLVDPALVGTEIDVDFTYCPNLQTVTSFVTNADNRMTADNTLVKAKSPIFVNALLEVSLFGESNDILNQIRTAFFSELEQTVDTASLSVSRLLSVMERAAENSVNIVSATVYGTQYKPDGTSVDLQAEDSLIAELDVAQGLSARTIQYIGESLEFVFV